MVDSASQSGAGRKLFYGLFVFPLIIAVGMAVLLCTVVLLTREDETPESLITAIKTGSPSKRWQKAFELSNELNQGRGMIRSGGVMKEVVFILNSRSEYDVRTRAYMALALSRFDDPEARAALRGALQEETEEDVQIHLLWALGTLRDAEAVDQVTAFLKHDAPELRKTAAYVLGVMGEPEKTIPPLRVTLGDPVQDVRWNAALSLARLGSDSGYGELLQMTDRKSLNAIETMNEAKAEEIMTAAVKGLGLLAKPESARVLTDLSESDPSLKVRQAAHEALKALDERLKQPVLTFAPAITVNE